jgi:hypothetical protein
MGTFSLNIGLITEASSSPLHIQNNFDDILLLLKDNDTKLIDPKDLRDAVLSIYSSIPFKQTSTQSIFVTDNNRSYIGLDAVDPTDRDIKRKIFIGKRANSGTFSYNGSYDIMNSTLLSNDIDIFLYNTKLDTIDNTITRVSILSGKNNGLYSISPFIQSQLVSGVFVPSTPTSGSGVNGGLGGGLLQDLANLTTESLTLDFVTKVGQVNFTNGYDYSSGSFSINYLPWPSIEYSNTSASDSTTLVWRGTTSSGYLSWEQLTLTSMNTIGTSGQILSIFGTPVNVNGYSLELNDSRYMPISLGGIPMGTTFDNVPIVDVLRRILYPYLGPLCSITIDSNYSEVGVPIDPVLTYIIRKRTNPTLPINLVNMNPGSLLPITSPIPTLVTGTALGIIPNSLTSTEVIFSVIVSDGIRTATASTFIKGIYPYFYGIVSSTTPSTILLNNLSKKIEYLGEKIVSVSGAGDFYFMFDSDYPDLVQVIDDVGNDVTSRFGTPTIQTRQDPVGYWTSKTYKVYKWTMSTPIPTPVNYKFIHFS